MSHNIYRKRSLFAAADQPKPEKKKRKWRIARMIWGAFRRTCMLLGFFMIVSAVISSFMMFSLMKDQAPTLPDQMVLLWEFEKPLMEHGGQAGPYAFQGGGMTLLRLVDSLDKARKDNRVKGLVATLKGGSLNLAQIEEVRAAVKRFRESGKFAYIYAPSYGMGLQGLGTYYLAAAFDEIWMQPMGILSIPGLNAELPFAKGTLDKIGVQPQMFARKEYKSVFESFTRESMSDSNKEMMTAIVEDIGHQMIDGVAADRDVQSDIVRSWVDQGLFIDQEAQDAGLIDRLDYVDMLTRASKEKATGDPESEDLKFVGMKTYARSRDYGREAPLIKHEKPRVALVYITGTIMQHGDGSSGGGLATADNILPILTNLAREDDITTVVLRIDSPGGSPTAAETIRRAVTRLQDKGKIVIVSMGGTAASGGYWIAANADYIFALPATLTGSIGVAGGKFVLQGLWDKLGVNWDSVSLGENADIWSFNTPYSESGRARMNNIMDYTYDAFINRVADGRHMKPADVDKVARGRVWTGNQAVPIGLVDEMGGLHDALDYAATLNQVPNREGVDVIVLPRPKSPVEKLLSLLETQVKAGAIIRSYDGALSRIPAVEQVKSLLSAHENSGMMLYEPARITDDR